MTSTTYPCTGHIDSTGFGTFLESELSTPRRNIQLFTSELKELLHVDNLSLVNSGSSANLVSAIAVKELRPNKKKVLLSSFSFPTTISSFELLGFKVELVDVEKDTFNISPEALKKKISSEYACVCITHFLGFPARLNEIKSLCDDHQVLLVQDACETMDLKIDDTLIYSFGDIITHSFYHPHHLSSFGGGAVISTKPETQKLIESIIHWGRTCSCHYDPKNCEAPHGLNHNFWYERLGINVEMSELNACFGRFQLDTWKNQEVKRNEFYNLYFDQLNEIKEIKLFANTHNISPFVFPIIVPKEQKELISNKLLEQGVENRSIMGGAIFNHPAYKHLRHDDLKNAQEISDSSFFIGVHQTLTKSQVQAVSNIVFDTLKKLL